LQSDSPTASRPRRPVALTLTDESAARKNPRAQEGKERGDPRPQLPGARNPGSRRLCRRFARPFLPGASLPG
jgi:hypothetical protein